MLSNRTRRIPLRLLMCPGPCDSAVETNVITKNKPVAIDHTILFLNSDSFVQVICPPIYFAKGTVVWSFSGLEKTHSVWTLRSMKGGNFSSVVEMLRFYERPDYPIQIVTMLRRWLSEFPRLRIQTETLPK